jgi:hypothetical protein
VENNAAGRARNSSISCNGDLFREKSRCLLERQPIQSLVLKNSDLREQLEQLPVSLVHEETMLSYDMGDFFIIYHQWKVVAILRILESDKLQVRKDLKRANA